MKRLLNKAKSSKEDPSDDTSPISPTSGPGADAFPPSASRRRWGKKKQQDNAKPQIDLAVALPPTDDFRTSLIMPGLSTRFSMLREQYDPNSLIGKANDDSVLPRRASRLLEDIDEVSSIHAPIRPPYASSDRKGSYASDGYTTDDSSSSPSYNGSIMSRSRPGEGNVLFGGRQKIYKIPIGDAGSVSNLGSGSARGMRGRALYEDDVSMSAFQRIRAREREAERRQKAQQAELDHDSIVPSVSLMRTSEDDRRNTTSSTNSGPPGSFISTSTAPTSLASLAGSRSIPTSPNPGPHPNPGLERSKFGSKRLYETTLEKHMHDQQAANLTRLNSIQKRGSGRGALAHVKSAPNLHEPNQQVIATPSGDIQLPSTEGLTTFDSLRNGRTSSDTYVSSIPKGPTPVAVVDNSPLTQALDSQDRGKATAMGAFNRPKQTFDEKQYLQRQQSLLKQSTPPSGTPTQRSREPSATRSGRPSTDSRQGRFSRDQPRSGSRAPSSEHSRTRRPTVTRPDRSWSSASNGPRGPVPQPASQLPVRTERREFEGQSTAPPPTGRLPTIPRAPAPAPATVSSPQSTLADDDSDASDYGETPEPSFSRGLPSDAPAPLGRTPPPLVEHPAMRAEQGSKNTSIRDKRSGWNSSLKLADLKTLDQPLERPASKSSSITERANPQNEQPEKIHGLGLDPTSAGEGLSRHMVRQHLRNISEVSSVYPNTPKTNTFQFGDLDLDIPVPVPSMYGEGFDGSQAQKKAETTKTDGAASTSAKSSGDSPTIPQFNAATGSSPRSPTLQVPQSSSSGTSSWEAELHGHHARGGSAATQAEREAFQDELAQRQRAIRENLKLKANMQNGRSASPGAANKTKMPFGLLRNQPSQESLSIEDARSRLERLRSGKQSPVVDGENGRQAGRSSSRVGRTLHSRMPVRASEDDSDDGERWPTFAPPDSRPETRERNRADSDTSAPRSRSRPRGSPVDHSRRNRLDTRTQQPLAKSRSPVDTPQSELQTKPSFESSSHVTSNTSSERPSIASTDRSILGLGNGRKDLGHIDTTSTSPGHSPISPISATYSTTMGETNTSLSQINQAKAPKENDLKSVPPSFTFPARKPDSRQRRQHKGPAVQKSDISEPTLISATSNVDTVDLPEGASLSNGATSDVDAVLAAQQAILANVDMMHTSFDSRGDRESQATVVSSSTSISGRKSPPIGGISIEKGLPASPPPLPQMSGKRRNGFMKAFGKREDNSSSNEDFDDFVTRPPGARLRIRKVSDEDGLGGRRRHEVVGAGEMDGGMI